MADFLLQEEVDGLRLDFLEALGDDDGKTRVTIKREKSSDVTLDSDTLQLIKGTVTTIYTGDAYLSPIIFRRDRQEEAGGTAVRIRQYRAILPWNSGDIHLDDQMTIDLCQDPQFVGRILTVSDVMYESEMIVRRITLVDTAISGDDC